MIFWQLLSSDVAIRKYGNGNPMRFVHLLMCIFKKQYTNDIKNSLIFKLNCSAIMTQESEKNLRLHYFC